MLPINQAYEWIQPGSLPPPVFEPEDVERCRQWLSQKNRERAAVLIAGGGSHWFLGNRPSRVTDILSVRRLNRILEYSPGDLTVTVQAGCPFPEVTEALKEGGQFLPFFPINCQDATLGGIVATGLSGPYGPSLGGPRDFLIGIEVLHAEGILSHAGGKVVKNVAGYDLCKLYTGSLGVLGVITRLTFKVRPRPQQSRTAILRLDHFDQLLECALRIRDEVDPAALEMVEPGAAFLEEQPASSRFLLAVQALDSAPLAEWKISQVRKHFPKAELLDEKEEEGFWKAWDTEFRRALRAENGMTIIRISSPLDLLAGVYAALRRQLPPAAMTGHFRDGTLFLFTPGPEFLEGWQSFSAEWISKSVYSMLFKTDAGIKEKADVWGLNTQPLSVMRKIKQQFDPHGILNPGRFMV